MPEQPKADKSESSWKTWTDLHWATRLVIVVAVCLSLGALVVSVALADPAYRAVYALLWIASVAVGALLGILATPYDRQEQDGFRATGATLSAFLSGFVVSKLDRLFERAFNDKEFLMPAFLTAVLSCLAVTLSIALMTAVIRQYMPTDDATQAAKPAQKKTKPKVAAAD